MCVSSGRESSASWRTTYDLECLLEGCAISGHTIMKRRAPALDRDALTAEIAGLSKASTEDLRERWRILYGKEPSNQIGRSFLIRAIAYRLQEKACGGLKQATRRLLARVAREAAAGNSPKKPQLRQAQAETVLIREWQGAAHRVTMLHDGVSFHGKRYRSLSEVAREITGSRWSGPRFFGLRLSPMEDNHGTL
jgi:hypothetical protein